MSTQIPKSGGDAVLRDLGSVLVGSLLARHGALRDRSAPRVDA